MPVPRPSYPMIAARQIEMLARESGIPDELVPSVSKLFRRVLDKQAMDERLNYQWIADNMGGGGGTGSPFIVVAASNTDPAKAAHADYVCDGSGDNVEIQAALDQADLIFGKVILLAGVYVIDATIEIPSHVVLEGESREGTYIEDNGTTFLTTDPILKLGGDYSEVANLYLFGINTNRMIDYLFSYSTGTRIINIQTPGAVYVPQSSFIVGSFIDELFLQGPYNIVNGGHISNISIAAPGGSNLISGVRVVNGGCIVAGSGNIITGCYFDNVISSGSVAGSGGFIVSGDENHIASCYIDLGATANSAGPHITGDRNAIVGCRIWRGTSTTWSAGIWITPTADRSVVDGNFLTFTGAVTNGAVWNQGTNTQGTNFT